MVPLIGTGPLVVVLSGYSPAVIEPDGGRSMNTQDIIKKIETLKGGYLTPDEQRYRLLGVALNAPVDKKADYVIITGCSPLYYFNPVRSVVAFLNHFAVDYTFLSQESCCGRPIVDSMSQEREISSEQRNGYEDFISRSLGKNIERARNLARKAIVIICPGCNVTWQGYSQDKEPAQIYYLDLVLELLARAGSPPKKGQGAEYDFFEGCHKFHQFTPDALKAMTENSRKVLTELKGLSFPEIPASFCCRSTPKELFLASKTGIIVTPSTCCYSFLTRSRSENDPEVKFLVEIVNRYQGVTGY